jgi:hypothetical protein
MAVQETICRGTVRNLRWHDSPTRSKVLSFRVEVIDDRGDVERHLPVEVDFIDVMDILVDGDEVEVTGELRENGILRPTFLKNLGTGATIDTGRPTGRMKYLVALALPFLLGAAGLVLSLGRSRGAGFGGLVEGFIVGCFLCIISWLIMAVIDHKRRT